MRIYKSDGKAFAELDETIELCDSSPADSLQTYKEALLERISKRFDWTVADAALRGMEKIPENKRLNENNK